MKKAKKELHEFKIKNETFFFTTDEMYALLHRLITWTNDRNNKLHYGKAKK